MTGRAFLAGALLVVVLGAAGCGAPDDEMVRPTPTATVSLAPPADLPDMPVGSGAVAPGDEVRTRGSSLVVNGRPIDLAPMRIDELAVVRGGVFFRNGDELWFTDLDRARATGYADVTSLAASPDGRRFAFVDLQHGPRDASGTPLAMSVAYDATTGKALVASYAGMGNVAKDDLGALYAKAAPRVVGFEQDALLVRGATGADYRIPFDGSAPEKVASSSS